MTRTLAFDVETIESGAKALVPTIDGRSLIDLVAAFESQRGYTPSGAYGGIVPEYCNLGDLTRYYEAREDRQWPSADHAWLLGCDCGEVGCWPLTARITLTSDEVRWSDFSQEYRPEWDYRDFGPFVFDLEQYRAAVVGAVDLCVASAETQ